MYRVRQVKVRVDDNNLIEKIVKKTNLKEDIKEYKILKQSIDARNKNNIYFVYEVVIDTNKKLKLSNDISIYKEEKYLFPNEGNKELKNRPVIIGSGPAGLFCALLLARYNYKPIIIERGEKVEDRVKTVEEFWENNKLNLNSNIQFGEGGAGTFSDGKLNTLISDKENRMKFVFEEFYKHGAEEEILYSYKPHIGTDVLTKIVKNIREEIISLGGEYRFNTCLKILFLLLYF